MPKPQTPMYFLLQSGMLDGRIQMAWVEHDVPATDYKSKDEPVRSTTVKSAYSTYQWALYEVRDALQRWPDHQFAIYKAPFAFRAEQTESTLVSTVNAQNIEQLLAEAKEAN